jgi:hypothetical protein
MRGGNSVGRKPRSQLSERDFYTTENISELVDNRVGSSNGSSGDKGDVTGAWRQTQKNLKALDKPRT